MKTLGLLGGMSWESTSLYYQQINRGIRDKLGGLHSAKLLLHSVNFAELANLQHQGNWSSIADNLGTAALGLQRAGAEGLLICTNTMHKVAEPIQQQINIPLLHIADATGQTLIEQKFQRVALLGTQFTMSEDFYRARLQDNFGLEVVVPNRAEQTEVHRIIYAELCRGQITPESKQTYVKIVKALAANGAEAVILGCTEIGLLLSAQDCDLPLFDTLDIHSAFAVEFALSA